MVDEFTFSIKYLKILAHLENTLIEPKLAISDDHIKKSKKIEVFTNLKMVRVFGLFSNPFNEERGHLICRVVAPPTLHIDDFTQDRSHFLLSQKS